MATKFCRLCSACSQLNHMVRKIYKYDSRFDSSSVCRNVESLWRAIGAAELQVGNPWCNLLLPMAGAQTDKTVHQQFFLVMSTGWPRGLVRRTNEQLSVKHEMVWLQLAEVFQYLQQLLHSWALSHFNSIKLGVRKNTMIKVLQNESKLLIINRC